MEMDFGYFQSIGKESSHECCPKFSNNSYAVDLFNLSMDHFISF
jgi:hypothetical protein